MTRPACYRQGDVLLVRLPDSHTLTDPKAERPEDGRAVLAHGELTGHHHSVPADCGTIYTDGERVLIIRQICALEHQEHAPIELEPGAYRIVHQREYHPQEIRRVAD